MHKRNVSYSLINDTYTRKKGINSLAMLALIVIVSVIVLWVFVYYGVPVRGFTLRRYT